MHRFTEKTKLNKAMEETMRKLERQAIAYANTQPMSFHTDSCNHLIANGMLNCNCSCKALKYRQLLREHGLMR